MISIGVRTITNQRSADDIAEEETEPEALVESFDNNCRRYKIKIWAEKIKLMISKTKVKEQNL